MAGRRAIRCFLVIDIHTPVHSHALVNLIALVDLSEHPHFIAEAKQAPDIEVPSMAIYGRIR